jgi:hypothetical protein
MATGPQASEGVPLGRDTGKRSRVVELSDNLPRCGIVGSTFEPKRALAHGGEKLRRGQPSRDPRAKSQAIETRFSENQRVGFACVEFSQPRVDVAANFDELEIRPQE